MRDIFYIFRKEFYDVFREPGVRAFFILLTLGYPIIYTYIYSNEVVRDVPVAVVDHSGTPLSREFLQMWDAAAGAEVAVYCASLEEAKVCMDRKEVYGILEIPADFSKNINRGVQAHVALYCNMGALLNYKALAQAASDVSLAMGKEIQMKRLDYASWIEQEIAVSPVKIAEVKL